MTQPASNMIINHLTLTLQSGVLHFQPQTQQTDHHMHIIHQPEELEQMSWQEVTYCE